jgi:pyrrolysine biosynthesis protein PylD
MAMTRLVENDISGLSRGLDGYDSYLKGICGRGLAGVAREASRGGSGRAARARVAVVPVTSGLGVITGFAEAVAEIARFMGHEASVTAPDMAGFAEALGGEFDVFFAADDDKFIAVNPKKGVVSDNSEATGRVFATALSLAAGGLAGKDALILGAGPVGTSAARVMTGEGAGVTVFDVKRSASERLRMEFPGVRIADGLEKALASHGLVLDATPSGGFIKSGMTRRDAILAAPGVPLCLDGECAREMRGRVIHDVLELGVAAMLEDAL